VAPITIDRSRRQLDVTLQVDNLVRPGKAMTIGYTTAKPSRVAVFAVDEGILQVAGFQTPQPLDHFLKKRALEVTTLQMLDLILPEYELIRRSWPAAAGPCARPWPATSTPLPVRPTHRRFSGPASWTAGLGNGRSPSRCPTRFPGISGSWPWPWAMTPWERPPKTPWCAAPSCSRPCVLLQAAPGDEFTATVGVANLVESSGEKAEIDVKVVPSDNLEIIAGDSTRLIVEEGGEARAEFRVRAGQVPVRPA
jgi:uncharacterized protein YfaS (alpha-2-macroglobulin family)